MDPQYPIRPNNRHQSPFILYMYLLGTARLLRRRPRLGHLLLGALHHAPVAVSCRVVSC